MGDLEGPGRRPVYLVFAVEQQQVPEGDWGEGGLLQQESQLLKTLRRLCVHVQQSLVVERHRVQLLPKHTHTLITACRMVYAVFRALWESSMRFFGGTLQQEALVTHFSNSSQL